MASRSTSITQQTADNRAMNATGDGSIVGGGDTNVGGIMLGSGSTFSQYTSDPDLVANVLSTARGMIGDSTTMADKILAMSRDTNRAVMGTSDSALAAVLSAKTDGGQSERILKIVAIAGAVLGAVLLLKR